MAKQQTPEEMQVMLNKSEAFITKYKKQLSAAVAVIIVIIVAWLGYSHFSATSQEEASTALAQGQAYFANEQYEEALNGDKKSFKGFISVMNEYSSTDAGNLATLYAGLCSAKLGKWNDAVNYLEDYSSKKDAMISPAAQFALGNAYANTKQLDKAVDAMKKAASMADSQAKDGINNSLSPTFLLRAADIFMSQNKNDEALAIYKEIKGKYVQSLVYQEIDKYIELASQK
ncbi:MAG: tetratricopeptide repeat protein [Bacteroidaceae bacterium]|nr:tetratricopeptide repeat protein [Bacteroidaceae bacterium]